MAIGQYDLESIVSVLRSLDGVEDVNYNCKLWPKTGLIEDLELIITGGDDERIGSLILSYVGVQDLKYLIGDHSVDLFFAKLSLNVKFSRPGKSPGMILMVDRGKYPSDCELCGSPCYKSMLFVECTNKECDLYHAIH